MTDLTDEQRLAEAVAELEREHRISAGDGLCHWCGDPPPCPTLRVILELRELRAEVGNQSCVAGRSIDTCSHCSYLRRKLADARDENERLGAALSSVLEHVEDTSITRGNEQCTLCFTYRDKIRAALANEKETK